MKDIVEYLRKKGKIFRSLKPIDIKELNSRKRVQVFVGVDMDDYYTMILQIEKRSKILSKEAMELISIHERLEILQGSKITKIYMLLKAPICSKARLLLEDSGWRVMVV